MKTETARTVPVVITKYLGPTETKPGRIVATTGAGSRVVVSWNHEIGIFENHAAAAAAAFRQIETRSGIRLSGRIVGGGIHNGGYAFSIVPR